ncbi:hypothetical protein GCM10012275_05120 [Longimycelium tulufanense]|uniref:RNA polymerase sigma-70 region 2 domain-containing protein n=1 Tax=Longimycelium tulufanense TaxID=907463 RepID=A0A8J3C646_9PSEU|nr:sigma-70 family RNA polymerase sigma factor [Longimycelium tulufanense]GGM36946.1 hypothetical protein GCM10012275_05120 [Longimycelium tulufanense]
MDHELSTERVDHDAVGDGDLLDRVRRGDGDAYAELYRRHVAAVRQRARWVAADDTETDDLTSETFARTLRALAGGLGPRTGTRSYLMTVLRRVAAEWRERRRDVPVPDHALVHAGGTPEGPDTRRADRELVAEAFTTLPRRWQEVLWQLEVEGRPVSEVATRLGLSATALSTLAWRARGRLRENYLRAHLPATSGGCVPVVDRLGAYLLGRLGERHRDAVDEHLLRCVRCRDLLGELRKDSAPVQGLRGSATPAGASGVPAPRRGTARPPAARTAVADPLTAHPGPALAAAAGPRP